MRRASGVDELAQAAYCQFSGELDVATVTYKGNGKLFFKLIAAQLDIPIETEDGKALTLEQLKDEVAQNASPDTLLILPKAKRLTTIIPKHNRIRVCVLSTSQTSA